MKTTIVTTTIYIPELLKDYTLNSKRHNHTNLDFIVVGDKKTPPEAEEFCKSLATESGYEIEYLNIANQEDFLKKYPKLKKHLPYNSIQRRNIGILKAYEKDTDIIITIDDDMLKKQYHQVQG